MRFFSDSDYLICKNRVFINQLRKCWRDTKNIFRSRQNDLISRQNDLISRQSGLISRQSELMSRQFLMMGQKRTENSNGNANMLQVICQENSFDACPDVQIGHSSCSHNVLNPSCTDFFGGKMKLVFRFHITSPHWNGPRKCNPFS